MSYAADDTFPVPRWDSSAWDKVLFAQDDIAYLEGEEVFYRPRRLLVDAAVRDDPRIADLLRDGGCSEAGHELSEAARDLGLVLLEADEDRVVEIVNGVRELIADGASLDHVLIAGPARWHGDDLPVPVDDPQDIPGTGEAGEGITIVVLDTGIDPKAGLDVQFGAGDEEIADEDHDQHRDPPAGHGTHIAGIIRRTAPQATIVAHRILKTVAGQVSELEFANALGALGDDVDIVNCSFSGAVLANKPSLAVERALTKLSPKTVVVACAGNTGTDRLQWPAASGRVLAVGAIARSGTSGPWLRTDFSSWGSWVACCAPGVSVKSAFLSVDAFNGWASWSGTSMSVPQVVASIAAVASRDGIDAPAAAAKLLDPSRPQVGQVGVVVDPADLP